MGTHYRITASFTRDGVIQDCSQAEVLGDELHRLWDDEDDALSRAEEMQGELADYDLDPTTTYSVVAVQQEESTEADNMTTTGTTTEREYTYEVASVSTDDDGAIHIATIVTVDGVPRAALWCAQRNAADGATLEPCGDSIDCWIEGVALDAFGREGAVAIGTEIIAGVQRGRRAGRGTYRAERVHLDGPRAE